MHIDAALLSSTLSLDLYKAGWNGAISPYPGQCDKQFAMAHLARSLTKKYLPGTSDRNASGDAAALALFTKVNESCRSWQLDTTSFDVLDAVIFGEFRSIIHDFFYPGWQPVPRGHTLTKPDVTIWFGPESGEALTYHDFILSQNSVLSGCGFGSGANIGAPESDLYSKLASSTLTATSQELDMIYVDAIRCDKTWAEMELSRRGNFGTRIVKGSRLSFVPKTSEISRTICTEPILNMFFQKGIAYCIEKRLDQVFGIDLSTQPDVNRELARLGSLTGKFGTIDLSSASDSISRTLCRELLPARVNAILERYRCPCTILPDGSELELHMVSSMGNAFTFPLQTLLFSSLVSACYRAYGIKPIRSRGSSAYPDDSTYGATTVRTPMKIGNFAVFGDDIIVDNRVYSRVCKMLGVLGFTVNTDKSFNEGLFRESCGHDYYCGLNVRGVYIKRLRDIGDCYSAINRLVRWSARHDIRLNGLVSLLRQKVRFLPVPYDEADDAGVKVPVEVLKRHVVHPKTGGVLYRYSRLLDRRIRFPLHEKDRRPAYWIYNPAGILKAFVAGSIRDGSVVLRTSRRRAVIRKRYSSRWDYISDAQTERSGYAVAWKAIASELAS